MESLALKYRPKEFNDVSSQQSLIKILSRQIDTKTFKNCYLFCGPSGTGKTTIARIFANKVNNGCGEPIEIDGASNNGVDNVRLIIDQAQERSLDSEYKVIIIDECHQITTAGWNAFLKCIEEPPKYTIFIFCTTDPQKIPSTIINRCQVFNLSRVNNEDIKNRLIYICNNESFKYNDKGLDLIVKLSQGSMRQAIVYLDKCKDYSNEINDINVSACLGDYSYDIYFKLTNSVVDANKQEVINIIENLYQNGSDLKLFVDRYFEFILQLSKYILFKSMNGISIPAYMEENIKYCIGFENNSEWFNKYLDKLLNLKLAIKNDNDIKTTIEVILLSM